MGLLIPGILAAAAAVGLAMKGKKGNSGGSSASDSIDESTLFPDGQAPVVTEPERVPLIQTQTATIPASSTVTTPAAPTKTSTSATSAANPAAKPATKWPNYPRVMFSQTNVGSYSPTDMITQMQAAFISKDLAKLTTVYKQFMALNNDQVRFFHNRYFEKTKVTPYAGWRTIKLTVGQQYVGNLLGKLNTAGVGETPKEKI